jgi:hypothetical protein
MMLSFEASQSCKCSDAIVAEARRVAVAVSRGDERVRRLSRVGQSFVGQRGNDTKYSNKATSSEQLSYAETSTTILAEEAIINAGRIPPAQSRVLADHPSQVTMYHRIGQRYMMRRLDSILGGVVRCGLAGFISFFKSPRISGQSPQVCLA